MGMKWSRSNFKGEMVSAKGLGASGTGTQSWITLRVAGILLMLLTPWFAWFLYETAGASHEEFLELLARPWHAIGFVLFAVISFVHSRLGLDEIIEDYVSSKVVKIPALIGIYFYYVLLGAVVLYAVAKVAFGAG